MHVVITGANRGIGHAMLQRFEARGDHVTGTERTPDPESDLVPLDVTQPGSIAGLVEDLDSMPVDMLVCNAGVYLDKGADLDSGFAPQLWADTFATNVTGVFLTIQALLPNLRAEGLGKIAIVSSQMGSSTRANGQSYIYRASKAAALNLGRNLATDLRADGIAVGIYHPGWVRTDMGGQMADISTEQAAEGLIQRFDALSLATTGCFEMWNGEEMPF
ncbi:MAG: SDR family oxidoreductase [Pseudomonadota bacterium]